MALVSLSRFSREVRSSGGALGLAMSGGALSFREGCAAGAGDAGVFAGAFATSGAVVPAVWPDGVGVDGAAVDDAVVDRVVVDGAGVDGAAVDGAAVDGAAVDGAVVDRVVVAGAADTRTGSPAPAPAGVATAEDGALGGEGEVGTAATTSAPPCGGLLGDGAPGGGVRRPAQPDIKSTKTNPTMPRKCMTRSLARRSTKRPLTRHSQSALRRPILLRA